MIAISGYRLERPIGRGGMSTVYLALQESVQREVALKVLTTSLATEEEFSQRFLHEARIAAALQHPNIVHIYDVGHCEEWHFIAMEYLPGGPLLNRKRRVLPAETALAVLTQIASALAYSHRRGVVHRDIKPDNILLREDGEAVLTDFGIARAIDSNRLTRTGAIVGTPHYMSPEQARGATLDGRSDIYSLGIVLHEMLTGSVPFHADDPVAVGIMHLSAALPMLPGEFARLQTLLDRLLAKDAENRFQSCDELLRFLRALPPPGSRHAALLDVGNLHTVATPNRKTDPSLGDVHLLATSDRSAAVKELAKRPKIAAKTTLFRMLAGLFGLLLFAAGVLVFMNRQLPQSSRALQLQAAQSALLSQRLDDDEQGPGARTLFEALRAEDPDSQQAREGLRQVARAFRDRAALAVQREDWLAAADDLREVQMLALPAHEWADIRSIVETHQQSEDQLVDLLRLAEQSMNVGRVETSDAGVGALEYYAEVLRRDGANAVAYAGQRKALATIADRVRLGIEEQRWSEAADDLALIARADPLYPEIAQLQSKLADARERQSMSIEETLQAAELAFSQRRWNPHDPASASALFRRILDDDSQHVRALDGMRRVGRALLAQADSKAANFEFDQADALLAQARDLQPLPEGLQAFEVSLDRRRAARQQHSRKSAEIVPNMLIAQAYEAMDQGHWLEPPGSSAFDLLRSVLSAHPDSVAALRAQRDMQSRLGSQLSANLDANRPLQAWKDWLVIEAISQSTASLQNVRTRLAASLLGHVAEQIGRGDFASAERALEHAAELLPNHPDLPALQARLDQAKQRIGHQ